MDQTKINYSNLANNNQQLKIQIIISMYRGQGENSFGVANQHKIYYNHQELFGNSNQGDQQQTNTFRLSQNIYQQPRFGNAQTSQGTHSNSKINLAELQYLHKISITRVQIQMLAFIDLLNLKFSNLKSAAFKKIKNCQNSVDLCYSHTKFSNQITNAFLKKMSSLIKIKILKQKASFFYLLKKKSNQFNSSNVHIKSAAYQNLKENQKQMRISSKSKVEPSHRQSQIDELNDTRGHADKKTINKQLKKKKSKQNQNFTQFYGQMDQLLSVHQAFLSKIK